MTRSLGGQSVALSDGRHPPDRKPRRTQLLGELGRQLVADLLGAITADEINGGFSDTEVEQWMETAVDPIDERSEDTDDWGT